MKLSLVAAAAATFFAASGGVSAAPVAEAAADLANDGPMIRVVERACTQVDGFYDDQPTKGPITFDGEWEFLSNQGSGFKFGTFSYTGQPNAQVIIPNQLPAGKTTTATISVWSSKKSDRGQFNVYVGKTLLGTGNQYTDGKETASQRVFTRQNIQLPAGQDFVIKNDKGAKYLGFDALELSYCA